MIRGVFEYHAPNTLEEVADLLAHGGEDTDVIGGGTWVVPEMTRGVRRPARIVDLRRVDLAGLAERDGHITIGPRTTYTQLERSDIAPELLRTMASGITGGPQVRNQGTIGGSACYANPASDVPGVLVALGATLRLTSARGEREVAAADFFRGAFTTDRSPDEVLSLIIVPTPADDVRYGYEKFKLVQGSWPIVTASCATEADGTINSLVIGGAATIPIRVEAGGVTGDLDALAARVFDAVAEPWTDVLAPGKYRRAISGVIAKRAVVAARNATEGEAT